MEKQLEEIRDQQKESWNRSSAGWKRWDDMMVDFLRPMADEMIRLLEPSGNDMILDVAAGTGEPGLTIAKMLTGGKVISTDLAEAMLDVAREHAVQRGINNFETRICDVSALPFDDNTFDSVSCRFGFMFFPDMLLAAKEMVRVLKPGGKIAAAVWLGPEKNFWFTGAMGVAHKHFQIPKPPAGAPSIFRCAVPGMMKDLFTQAGIKNVSEKEVAGTLRCSSAELYWNFTSECVGPIVTALSKTDDATREHIHHDVVQLMNEKYPSGNIAIDATALVIYGQK